MLLFKVTDIKESMKGKKKSRAVPKELSVCLQF